VASIFKSIFAALFALTCIITNPAEAKSLKQISAGGVMALNSDYIERLWGTGFTIGIGTALKVKKNLFVTADLNYYHLSLSQDRLARIYRVTDIGGTTNIIDFTVNFKPRLYPTEYRNSPYIVMGGGFMYKTQAAIKTGNVLGSDNNKASREICPLYDFGFGFDCVIRDNKGFFIEAKFVYGFFEKHSTGFFPIKVGFLF
jgi:hypothetical protein